SGILFIRHILMQLAKNRSRSSSLSRRRRSACCKEPFLSMTSKLAAFLNDRSVLLAQRRLQQECAIRLKLPDAQLATPSAMARSRPIAFLPTALVNRRLALSCEFRRSISAVIALHSARRAESAENAASAACSHF